MVNWFWTTNINKVKPLLVNNIINLFYQDLHTHGLTRI